MFNADTDIVKISARFVFTYDLTESYNGFIEDHDEHPDIIQWSKDQFDGHDFNEGAMRQIEVIVGETTGIFTEKQQADTEHFGNSARMILKMVESGMVTPTDALIQTLKSANEVDIDRVVRTLPQLSG